MNTFKRCIPHLNSDLNIQKTKFIAGMKDKSTAPDKTKPAPIWKSPMDTVSIICTIPMHIRATPSIKTAIKIAINP